MRSIYIRLFLQSALLIFLQVVLFNNVRVMTYLIPILYGYPLLKLPIQTKRWVLLLLSAGIGLCMDVFMNTPGLNMAAFTLVGYLRNPILHALSPTEVMIEADPLLCPTISVLRLGRFILYISSCVAIHVTTLFLLESFSTQLFSKTILYILGSLVMTVGTFLIFEAFGHRRRG